MLEIGDIVHLKSGSPELRVIETGVVTVEWKNDQNEIERTTLHEICLEKTAVA
jgi:hypothetical protein